MAFSILSGLILASVTVMFEDHVSALCSTPYCLPPWLTFQGHCYLWVNMSMPWLDAERYCQMLSHPGKIAHLTSINSKEEDEFIKYYVEDVSGRQDIPGYWIGFNDWEREGSFKWTDGSDVSYEGWQPSEPNQKGNENCVERFQYHDGWNDIVCASTVRFVCKI